jgi:hypothetical protein
MRERRDEKRREERRERTETLLQSSLVHIVKSIQF